MLDINDVPSRIDELKSLRDGWLDGIGKAPSKEGLNWLSVQFDNYASEDMTLPLVFPTEEGNVQMEWSLSSFDISLEVDLNSHNAELHIFGLNSDNEKVHDLDLEKKTSWEELAKLIGEVVEVKV